MEFERTSMTQFTEIKRLIEIGQTNRQIARSIKCRRSLVGRVRRGEVTEVIFLASKERKAVFLPSWALQIDWETVEKDIKDGFEIKRIWEEVAGELTSQSNFFKYVKARFSYLLEVTVTLREFKAGEYCEVDYAGDKIDWVDARTGEVHEAHVFLGILCFSQKLFAIAHPNEKKQNWLDAHRRMFEAFGGVPQVVVPDCLKNGVIKCHRYDPELNPDYVELAKHYGIAVVPARARHPRDKALVENAVGILMRYFRFIYRRRTFTSIGEVNRCLVEAVDKINAKVHTRFKISRQSRYETLEKASLQTLPIEPFSLSEWKNAILHPDCTVACDHNFYSAPHLHRGKELRVKVSAKGVEIFLNLDRIALHIRALGKVGERIIDPTHLPENSRAYRERTPQLLLAQAKFSHPELHKIIDGLFEKDTLGNLRRAQGLVKKAFALIRTYGRGLASGWILNATVQMRAYNRFHVRYFEDLIKSEMAKKTVSSGDRTIVRKPGNPMVRGHGTRKPGNESVPEQLKLV